MPAGGAPPDSVACQATLTWNLPVVASRLGSAEPLSVAVVEPTEVAAEVLTDGTSGVVKLNTVPTEVPWLFEASALKYYVVPAVRPVSAAVYGVAVLPEPSEVPPLVGARMPKLSLHVPGLVVA